MSYAPFTMQPGDLVLVGKKLFTLCRTCGKIVRVNKPIVGGLHVCEEDPR